MKKQGEMLVFDYPGGQIIFHEDLKKYYEILSKVRSQVVPLQKCIQESREPEEIVANIQKNLIRIIRTEILPLLAKNSVYNAVQDDFLRDNPGLVEIVNAAAYYYEYVIAITEQIQAKVNEANAELAEQALSTITGPGYSILSNDMLAHAVYTAQSERIIKKQSEKAKYVYEKSARAMNNHGREMITETKQNQKKECISKIRANIPLLFDSMASVCFNKMVEAGVVAASCIDGIDENRSNALLENLNTMPAKEQIIYSAIQLCPYNINAYRKAYEFIDITTSDCFKDTMGYFNILPNFYTWVLATKDHTKDIYSATKKVISVIAFLKELPEKDVAQEVLRDKFQDVISPYVKLGTKIKNHQSIQSEIEGVFGKTIKKLVPNIKQYTNYLKSHLSSLHINSESVEYYQQSGFDIFAKVSDAFGEKIDSFAQADKLILSAWEKEESDALEKHRQSEKQRLYNQELVRRQTFQEELDELEKKYKAITSAKDMFLEILLSIPFCVLGIGLIGMSLWIVSWVSWGFFMGIILGGMLGILGGFFVWMVIRVWGNIIKAKQQQKVLISQIKALDRSLCEKAEAQKIPLKI